jgi:hypothetical protein
MLQEIEKVAKHLNKIKEGTRRGLSKNHILGSFVMYIYTVLSRFLPTIVDVSKMEMDQSTKSAERG